MKQYCSILEPEIECYSTMWESVSFRTADLLSCVKLVFSVAKRVVAMHGVSVPRTR